MIENPQPRKFRSVLYVPAINERAIAKAATLPADAIILDLEDAVAPDSKPEARRRARAALESRILAPRTVIVRVNGLPEGDATHEWLADDLAEIAAAGADAVLFPKIRTAADVARAEGVLDHHFAPAALRLWLMIETPQAILNLKDIVTPQEESHGRLEALVMGTNDLAKEMRLPPSPSRLPLLHALSATVMAARARDLFVLDGVFGRIEDATSFESECHQGRALGFDGKTLVHPAQIEIANRAFSPSEAERMEAEAIVRAFENPDNAGRAVLVVNGRMVEDLHYRMAKQVLALAQ
ncbi:MAG: HpcH/HpaI aldolase/citrate lyase family protein [Rhabdaerophilum sp.]